MIFIVGPCKHSKNKNNTFNIKQKKLNFGFFVVVQKRHYGDARKYFKGKIHVKLSYKQGQTVHTQRRCAERQKEEKAEK